MSIEEKAVPIADLEMLRDVLTAAVVFFEATDLAAAAQQWLTPGEMTYGPLTQEASRALERVEGHLKDHIFEAHYGIYRKENEDQESLFEVEAEEPNVVS